LTKGERLHKKTAETKTNGTRRNADILTKKHTTLERMPELAAKTKKRATGRLEKKDHLYF